jgi:outer membrane protein assembly factor BamE (lipoprotein component of BamABCDE complex)
MKGSYLFFLLCFFLLACAHDPNTRFQRVKVGMEKDEVLELLDSPHHTQRTQGKDRWTYIFYNEDQRMEKEIDFDNGRATYVGDIPKPEVSAEDRDAKNEVANKELDAQIEASHQEARKNFSDYESHVHGQDSIRYVPQFAPVQ